MKGSQKKWQQNSADSVIATLMGFDELHPQRPFQEKRRALSETYIRKVASIALRQGSLVSTGHSCSTNNEILDGDKGATGVWRSKGKNENVHDECVNLSTSNVGMSVRSSKPAGALVSKSLSGNSYRDKKSIGKKGEHCALRSVLRYQQKLEYDPAAGHLGGLGVDSMCNSLNFPLEMIDRPRLFSTSISGSKPKSEKEAYDLEDVKFDIHSTPRYRENRNSLMPVSATGCHDFTHKELVVNDIVSPRHSCIACTRTMNRISRQERHRSKFEEELKQGYKNYSHDPHLLFDQSSLANKSRKQNFERWKTAKKVLESAVSRSNQSLNEMLALAQKKSMPKNSVMRLGGNGLCGSSGLQSRSPESSKIQGVRDETDNCFENDGCKEIEPSQKNSKSSITISKLAAQYRNDASYASKEAFNEGDCSRINVDPQSESHPGILSGEGEHSSNVEEIFSREASFNELSEEESAYSNCSGIGPPESLENMKRTYQHSPDSVLEPFDAKNPSPFGCFDRIGLQLQLQALNFEPEETYSEGSVMLVSGDEDSEEQFGDLSHDGGKVKRWLGDYESRNFFYLVDVLDEAGFRDMNSFVGFNTWDPLECPISPSVFDLLEKKYGKQTSWRKSERQLLFDRINSGLMEILNPVINFHSSATSIRRRFCSSFTHDEIEDELWMMLISQEKERSKDLSETALDKWLEVEEGINIICRELETSLFDELAMELASLWN